MSHHLHLQGGGCQELLQPRLSHLLPRNAPPSFAAAVTHEAISQLLQTDLSEFKRLPEQEEEEEEEEEEKALVTCKFHSYGSGIV